MATEVDIGEECPEPEYSPPRRTGSGAGEDDSVILRIREFPDQTPESVRMYRTWTVEHAQKKYADAKGKPRDYRFVVNDEPLRSNAKIGELPESILSGKQAIDVAPATKFASTGGGPSFSNLDRIAWELRDLRFKKDYGTRYRVTLNKQLQEPMLHPTLYVKFRGSEYRFAFDLSRYPKGITGRFVGAIPPCPEHGRKHPHVFSDGSPCWNLNWNPSMTLREFIAILIRLLNTPQHHFGCSGYRTW